MTSFDLKVGDVVQIDLKPSKGAEQFKERPCLVVEAEISPLKLIIVLPITDATGKTKGMLFVPIKDIEAAGLAKPSVIDCFQIRALDRIRIKKVLGHVEDDILDKVRQRLAAILDIGQEHLLED